MKQHEHSFDLLWEKIVKDTTEFTKDNEETPMYSLQNDVEKFADSLALSSAWIQDCINNKLGFNVHGSMRKKIRKALGYTYP